MWYFDRRREVVARWASSIRRCAWQRGCPGRLACARLPWSLPWARSTTQPPHTWARLCFPRSWRATPTSPAVCRAPRREPPWRSTSTASAWSSSTSPRQLSWAQEVMSTAEWMLRRLVPGPRPRAIRRPCCCLPTGPRWRSVTTTLIDLTSCLSTWSPAPPLVTRCRPAGASCPLPGRATAGASRTSCPPNPPTPTTANRSLGRSASWTSTTAAPSSCRTLARSVRRPSLRTAWSSRSSSQEATAERSPWWILPAAPGVRSRPRASLLGRPPGLRTDGCSPRRFSGPREHRPGFRPQAWRRGSGSSTRRAATATRSHPSSFRFLSRATCSAGLAQTKS